MKRLINIKNNDNKCFLWCHVRHLNLNGVKLERISKKDKEISKDLNYSSVDFPVSKKYYSKIEVMILILLILILILKLILMFNLMKVKLFTQFIYLISVLMIV